MAKKNNKKKQTGGGQQFLSHDQFVRQRMRSLPIGKCYISDTLLNDGGMCHVVVTRQHTGGRVSMALFMVDQFCVGVKESFYRLRLEPYELDEMLDASGEAFSFRECSYDEAHNRIYGAIAFAEEGGIKPDNSFLLTQYFLEDDTNDVPLIEFEYGKNGKHFLVCDSQLEASKYLPALRKTLGDDGFTYVIGYENIDDNLNDDKMELLSPGPVSMRELVSRISYKELYGYAEVLDPYIEDDLYLEQLRRTYIDLVLDDPLEVLSHFTLAELNYLKELSNHPEWGCEAPYYAGCITPLMVHYGFAEEGFREDSRYVVRLAEDFWQAVRPYVGEAMADKTNNTRWTVEMIVEGMANLYGEVNRKTVVDYLKKEVLKEKADLADELFDMVWERSMLLDWMLQPIEGYDEPTDSLPPEKVIFVSRYGWEDVDAMRRETARRSALVMHPRPFTMEEIADATREGFPLIANKRQKQFENFLKKKLGCNEEEILIICYELWQFAQHEGDDDAPDSTCDDYFRKAVLCKDDTKRQFDEKLKEEALRELDEYIDNMPRWTLKGYAPAELG